MLCLILHKTGRYPNAIYIMAQITFLWTSTSTLTYHLRYPNEPMFGVALFMMMKS